MSNPVRVLLPLALLLSLSTCRGCGSSVSALGPAVLVVSPAALSFPDTYLGHPSEASLTLTNTGGEGASVVLTIQGPFSAVTPAFELERGDTVTVGVTFSPVEAGVASGVLAVGPGLTVPLSGRALALPSCAAKGACRTAHFDTLTKACVEQVVPDTTSCVSACVESGQCHGGRCEGLASSACDDGDACTTDACGETGCVHLPVVCTVIDPCQVASCAADGGCSSQPVDDGVPCGAASCATAFICLRGTCQQRPRPNALTECTYDDVTANFSDVCAHTLAGTVRCWGSTGPRAINGPHLVDAPPGLRFIPNSGYQPLTAVDANGQPWVYSPSGFLPLLHDGGLYPAPVTATTRDEVLLADGSLATPTNSRPFLPDAGVRALTEYLVLLADGGIWSLAEQVSKIDLRTPAVTLEQPWEGGVCARTSTQTACFTTDGHIPTQWPGDLIGPAEALVGGTQVHGNCLAERDGGARCTYGSFQFPLGLRKLTSGHDSALCGLSGAGQIACAGRNSSFYGGLGDLTMLPTRPVTAPLSGAAILVGTGDHFTAAVIDAGVWVWGWSGDPDAGLRPRLLDSSPSGVRALVAENAWGAIGQIGRLSYIDGLARLHVSTPGGRPLSTRDGVATVNRCRARSRWNRADDFGSECGLLLDGGWYGPAESGRPNDTSLTWPDGNLAAVEDTYLARDAGVRVVIATSGPLPWNVVPVPLPGPATAVSEGCALLVDHRVFCWPRPTPGATQTEAAIPIPGLLPARSVGGTLESGCALVGTNGVQCWGTNKNGLLANERASSASAVFVPMPEPVQQLSVNGHACVLLQSGAVRCWGLNNVGQLGLEPISASDEALPITQ